jgi:hypothetical protein
VAGEQRHELRRVLERRDRVAHLPLERVRLRRIVPRETLRRRELGRARVQLDRIEAPRLLDSFRELRTLILHTFEARIHIPIPRPDQIKQIDQMLYPQIALCNLENAQNVQNLGNAQLCKITEFQKPNKGKKKQ